MHVRLHLVSYTWNILYILLIINTMLIVHYKYFLLALPLPVECLDGFILSILSLSFFIRSWIFNAGPILWSSKSKISFSDISNKRLPSTFFFVKISQCAAQSLIRKNWPTSNSFHVSGANSSPFCAVAAPPVIKQGMYFAAVTREFCEEK